MKSNKKRAFHIIYGRTFIIIFLLAIQIYILISAFNWLSKGYAYIYTIFNIITTILVIYIMNKKGNPYFKLAWMIPILVFPIFGALFYMFVEFQIGGKLINNRLSEVIDETQKFLSQDENVINELKREDMQV